MANPSFTYSFQRVESKYVCTDVQAEEFFSRIKDRVYADKFGKSIINSLYYDSVNCDMIRRSCDKPYFKEKMRARSYGNDKNEDSTVFLELKRKTGDIGVKRRIEMTLRELDDYMLRGIYPKRIDSQILHEIDYVKQLYAPVPKLLVSCEREAFFSKSDPQFRISFDRNLRCSDKECSLPRKEVETELMLPENMRLIELKGSDSYELWLAEILAELKMYPVSFSKYGQYYKKSCSGTMKSEERYSYV